jgi:glycosyltransferase involved in cell wall biosynthesis
MGVRILHVHTRYRERGGEDTVVAAERSLLERAGHEVLALDFENPSGAVETSATLVRSAWNTGSMAHVADAIRRTSPDVAHVHNTWYALSPGVFPTLRKWGVPTVATFHNYRLVCVNAMLFRQGAPCELCVGQSPWPGIRYGCYRDSRLASSAVALTIGTHRWRDTWSRDVSAAITLTEFSRRILLTGGLPAERTHIVPNFVDDPGGRVVSAAASNEILYVGRLSPEKGVDLLIEAWRGVGLDGLRLLIVGDGPESARLRESCPDGVEFLGRIASERVAGLMLGARALVLPSLLHEGQPMVILEALSAGLPVLYADLGALGETVGAGGWGFLAGDSSSLAEGLVGTLSDAAVDVASDAARTEFLARFHPERALQRRLQVYAEARAYAR